MYCIHQLTDHECLHTRHCTESALPLRAAPPKILKTVPGNKNRPRKRKMWERGKIQENPKAGSREKHLTRVRRIRLGEIQSERENRKQGMVTYSCHSSTADAKAGGLLWVIEQEPDWATQPDPISNKQKERKLQKEVSWGVGGGGDLTMYCNLEAWVWGKLYLLQDVWEELTLHIVCAKQGESEGVHFRGNKTCIRTIMKLFDSQEYLWRCKCWLLTNKILYNHTGMMKEEKQTGEGC